MSAQSAKKKRFGSRRRAANQNEISKGDEFHTTDSTFVAQYHIPEENTESLNEIASPDNSQSETQPLPSPELSGNRRKLGSSRRNKRQHVKDSETGSHHNPREEVEEKTRGEETTETKQMSLVIQHKRQEELSQGAVDDISATHDESLYSAVTPHHPSEVQNSTINYAEADLESLIPKSENLQVDQDENETNSRVVSDSCKLVEYMQAGNDKSDTLHSEDVKESEHLVGISELSSLSVLSCPTVDPQLIDQLNSREMPEEKFPNMYSTAEKDSNERDDNTELLKQDGNLQGNFIVSESHVESVSMQFSTTPVITTEKMSSRENTDTECSVWQAALSTTEEVLHTDEEQNEHFNLSEVRGDHQSEDDEQKIKPTEIHEITSEMLIHDATENPEIISENLTDQTDMSGTQQPEFIVKITDDSLTSNEISGSYSKQNEHHTEESNTEALEEKNKDYHVYHTKKPPISDIERVDTALGQVSEVEGQVEDDVKPSVEQTDQQFKERLFHEMEESESPLRTLQSEVNAPFDSQHQQNDTGFNPLGNRRKLGSSRRNKGRQHVKDSDAESHHEPAEDVVGNTRDNEPLETTEMSSTIETAMQGKTNETMLEGIDKFDTAEAEDGGDQVKENALGTDIHSGSTEDQQTIDQLIFREMPDKELLDMRSVTEIKERDENTELLKQWGILQSNYLVSEDLESSITSEITTDNHDPREHTEPEYSVEQALFSLPKEELPTNEEQNEHFSLSEVKGDHQSQDPENKVHEQEIEPTEMPQTEHSSERLIHDATEISEIISENLTNQTEVSDAHQSEWVVKSANDSPFKQDISNPVNQQDEHLTKDSNFEVLEQKKEDNYAYDTKTPPISNIERVDTALSQIYEMEGQLEDDIKPSDEQTGYQKKGGVFSEIEENESSLQTLQSEINASFDSQHQQNDTGFNPLGNRRKLGSSRRNRGRRHVKDSDAESHHEPTEDVVGNTSNNEPLETTEMSLTIETAMQGETNETMLEGIDKFDTETEDVGDQVKENKLVDTDVLSSSTEDRQTIDQSNIREIPDQELPSSCSVTEKKEGDENTELLKQWGILQSDDLVSEDVESSVTSEITTDNHDPREHTEPEYSVEQALFSLPKEELPTNEEQNEHFNLSEVSGDHQSQDAESKVHEQEIKPTERPQTEHSSEMLIDDATENPEITSENLTDQTEISDTHQSDLILKIADDSPTNQEISNPDDKEDEHHTEESNVEPLEQKNEDYHVYDTKKAPASNIERVDTALGQVSEVEGQLEDDMKSSVEQRGHQDKEGLFSEIEESESSLQTLQSEVNAPFDSQHQQNDTGFNPLGNRRKLGSSRRNKGRRHVKDSDAESHHEPTEDVVRNTSNNEPLETTLTTETAVQEKTNETILEGIDKFDTTEAEDVRDQVKENERVVTLVSTDLHSSSTVDQQTIDQSNIREMPDEELPSLCSVTEKEMDEDTELLGQSGILQSNDLVSEDLELSITSEITTDNHDPREHTEPEYSVEQALFSLPKEELPTNEEQNEHFNLSEVSGDHQSQDAESKVHEQEIEPTEMPQTEHSSEMLIDDATENPEITSGNLTDQTEVSDTHQSDLILKSADDSPTNQEISNPDDKEDEHHTEESNVEPLEQKNEDYHVYDTKKAPASNIERVDTALGQVSEVEGQLEDDMKSSVEQRGHQDMEGLFSEIEESESSLQTLQSEVNAPFDPQHQQNDTGFNPLGNRRKLGSSRRNRGRRHVKDSDAESHHEPTEDVVGNTSNNEPLETTEMSLTTETAVQEKTNETMLEGINKFDTTEAEDGGDQVKENEHVVTLVSTDLHSSSTVDQQTIDQSNIREMPDEELPSLCSVTEKEMDEDTELLGQSGILQSNYLVSEDLESSITSEITTDNHDPREHTEPEYSVEQALFSLPKEELPTNEEQNEHFSLSEVKGDRQSQDAESKVHEQEIEPTEMPQTEHSSERLIHDATENSEITPENLTNQTEVSDAHQSELSVNSANDSPFKQDILDPNDKEDEHHTEESNFETLEQNHEEHDVYDTKTPPICNIERVDTALSQVYEMEGQLEDDRKSSAEQTGHQEREGVFSEMEESESFLQTLQSERNAHFDSQHQQNDTGFNPLGNRRKLGSSRRNKGRRHVKDSDAESHHEPTEEVVGNTRDNEPLEKTEMSSATETAVQEETNETMLEGIDKSDTAETEDVGDQVKEKLVDTDVLSSSTEDHQTIDQSNIREIPDQELPSSCSVTERKERDENMELLKQWGILQSNDLVGEDVESSVTSEITTDNHDPREHTEPEYSVEQALFSLPKEELPTNEEQNEHFNLSEVKGDHQSPFDSQHQQNDTGFNPLGNKRKLGSSRRNRGRRHVKDSDAESHHEPTEDVVGSTSNNEPLETIETAVQEKTNETMLEGIDKFDTTEAEDGGDQVKENEHVVTLVSTDLHSSSTVDQQTIDQSNIREMPDEELPSLCSVTEKEMDEDTELLGQSGILQSNYLVSEDLESSITSEITTDNHDPREHTEPEYSVEQALFSLPKEELPTNEEQNEHFNLSEVSGDHQSQDAESKVHEQEIKPTEMSQTEHSSEMLIDDATENPEITSGNLTDQTEVSDTHQSDLILKSADDSPTNQEISNPDDKEDEHHTEESNVEPLEQKNEDYHVYDTKKAPASNIERVDTALGQVSEVEGQLEDDMKSSVEQRGHQDKEGLFSEIEESESSLQTLQSEVNAPFDPQHQQNDTGFNPLGNRRKLGSSRRNRGRRHVKDSDAESHHEPTEDVVGNTSNNEPLETTEMSLTTETAVQEKTNETMLEGINKFDTTEAEDGGDQVKENEHVVTLVSTDLHSSSTVDQQTIDQSNIREMPDEELPSLCSVTEKEMDEDTELLGQSGILQSNYLVSEHLELSITSEITTDNHDPREHTEPEYSVEHTIFSLPKEELPTNEEQNEHFNLSEVSGDHQSQDAESKVHEQEIEPTEMPQTEHSSERLIHDATENSEITSENLTNQTEVSDAHQSELSVNSADDSPFKQDILDPNDKEDEHHTEESNFETLEQNHEEHDVYDTKTPPICNIERVDTALSQVYEMEGQLEDDRKSSAEQTGHQEREGVFSEMEESESFLQTLQSERNAHFDSQHQQNDTGFNPLGNRRKLGSSRRNKGRRHVKDSDAESHHEPTEEVVGNTRDNEPLEKTEMSSATETAVQEETNETMLEGIDKSDTAETEDVGDQVKEKLVDTDVLSSSTVDHQTIDQSNIREIPDQELPSSCSVTEKKEGDENTELLKQWGILQSDDLVSEDVESSVTSEITTDNHDPREHTEPEYSVEQALFSLPKEELPTNEEQNEHFNLSEVKGDHQSPFDSQHQQNDTGFNPLGNKRKLGSSRRNRGRRHVKDSDAESHHEPTEDVVGSTSNNEPLETTETAVQEKTNETMLEGIDKFDTTEAEDGGDQVKENEHVVTLVSTDLHSSSTVDQQTIDQSNIREMPDEELSSSCSVTEKEMDEDTELLGQSGILQSNYLVSEDLESSITSEITTDNHDPREHTEPEYSVEQALFSLPKEELPTNEEQNEHFSLSQVKGDRQSQDPESKVHEQEIEPTEMPQTEHSSERLIHDATENSEITSENLTDQTEVSDAHQSEWVVKSANDSPFKRDISNPNDTERVDTALGHMYEMEGRLEDDIKPSVNQTGHQEEENESSLQTVQSEVKAPFDSQHQQKDTGFNPLGNKRKLGSSRRNRGRRHVKDSDAESHHEPTEEVVGNTRDNEPLETSLTIETAVQEKTNETMLEGIDKLHTAEAEDVSDQVKDNEYVVTLVGTDVHSTSTVDQQTMGQLNSREMPDKELPNVCSAPEIESKDRDEDTGLLRQDGNLQTNFLVSESRVESADLESSITQEITTDKHSQREHTEIECIVEQAVFSSSKEGLSTDEEHKEPKVRGAHHLQDAVNEEEVKSTQVQEMHQIDNSSVMETESSLQTLQSEMNTPLDSHPLDNSQSIKEQTHTGFGSTGNRRKLGSSRRNKGRLHVEDTTKISLVMETTRQEELKEQTGLDFKSAGEMRKIRSAVNDGENTDKIFAEDTLLSQNVMGNTTNLTTDIASSSGKHDVVKSNKEVSDEENKLMKESDHLNQLTGCDTVKTDLIQSTEVSVWKDDADIQSISYHDDSVTARLIASDALEQEEAFRVQNTEALPSDKEISTQKTNDTLETMRNVIIKDLSIGGEGLMYVQGSGQDEDGEQFQDPMKKDHKDREINVELFSAGQSKTDAPSDIGLEEKLRAEPAVDMSEESGISSKQEKTHLDGSETLQVEPKQRRRKMGSTRRSQLNRKPEEKRAETTDSDFNTEADVKNLDKRGVVEELPVTVAAEVSPSENAKPSLSPASHSEEVVDPVKVLQVADVRERERNVDVSVEPSQIDDFTAIEVDIASVLTGDNSINPLLSANAEDTTEESFVSLCETTQSAQNEDRPESVSITNNQALKSAEQPDVAVLDIVKYEVRGGTGEEHLSAQTSEEEPDNMNEGAHNKNPEGKSRRRKLGSSRRNLPSRTKREDLNQKQEVDDEATEAATNVGDVKTESLSGIIEDEEQLHIDKDIGSEERKETAFETEEHGHTVESQENPVSGGQLVETEHQPTPNDPSAIPSSSPKQDSVSELASSGKRRKMGSHRKSHGHQNNENQTAGGDRITDAQNGQDVRGTRDQSAIKTTEELREKSLGLDKIPEVDESDKRPSSNISTSKEGEHSRPVSDKTPQPVTPIQHRSADIRLGQEIQTKFSLAGNARAADLRSNAYNVMMIGDSCVGKTSFIKRAQSGKFSLDLPASVGLDSCMWTVVVEGKPVVLQLWDTAGQERFHSITRQIFHKAQAFLLMYDITCSQSFSAVSYWASCIQEDAAQDVMILLVGNKSDCAKRQVKTQEAESLAKEYNFEFMECSAATGENVVQSLETVARMLSQRGDTREEAMVLHKEPQKKKSSGCC